MKHVKLIIYHGTVNRNHRAELAKVLYKSKERRG